MKFHLNAHITILLLALLSCPATLPAHTLNHDPTAAPQPPPTLEEQLGARIPLDATFRDETGRSVKLRDLVTGPTIILPVYYSCTNICNFLQSGLAQALPAVKSQPDREYRIISVSIDETEGPELAARYRKTYLSAIPGGFPDNGWRFLTGDRENIRTLTSAAGYQFRR